MSMNLTLHVVKKACGCTQRIDVYQTPTDITYKILAMENPMQGYFDWLDSLNWHASIVKAAKEQLLTLAENSNLKLEWSCI